MGDMRDVYKVFTVKPEGKRLLRRSRHRWKDDLREVGWESMDWINLTQHRDWWWQAGSFDHSNEPLGSINFLAS